MYLIVYHLSSSRPRRRPTPPHLLSCEQAASYVARMRSTRCTPSQGGEEEWRNTPPTPPLLFSSSRLSIRLTHLLTILAMEEAAYSQDRGQGRVGHLLHRKEERRHTMEYTVYSSSRWRRKFTPCHPSCIGGQRVGPILNCDKIARWRGGVQRLRYPILRRGW